jgi:CXXX repeat modification system protein
MESMESKRVGKVSESEKIEIQKLYERKLALKELISSLDTNLLIDVQRDELYEKVIQDIGRTNYSFEMWWKEKGMKYNWESAENGRWTINFDTDEIFLVANA